MAVAGADNFSLTRRIAYDSIFLDVPPAVVDGVMGAGAGRRGTPVARWSRRHGDGALVRSSVKWPKRGQVADREPALPVMGADADRGAANDTISALYLSPRSAYILRGSHLSSPCGAHMTHDMCPHSSSRRLRGARSLFQKSTNSSVTPAWCFTARNSSDGGVTPTSTDETVNHESMFGGFALGSFGLVARCIGQRAPVGHGGFGDTVNEILAPLRHQASTVLDHTAIGEVIRMSLRNRGPAMAALAALAFGGSTLAVAKDPMFERAGIRSPAPSISLGTNSQVVGDTLYVDLAALKATDHQSVIDSVSALPRVTGLPDQLGNKLLAMGVIPSALFRMDDGRLLVGGVELIPGETPSAGKTPYVCVVTPDGDIRAFRVEINPAQASNTRVAGAVAGIVGNGSSGQGVVFLRTEDLNGRHTGVVEVGFGL